MSTDGDGYLVVWRDGRTMSSQRLLAARVSRDGDVLDRFGFLVADAVSSRHQVAWTGSTYVVAWSGDGGGPKPRLVAATIGRNGGVSAPQVLADDALLMAAAHASAGNATMLLYMRGNSEVRAVLLDREARPVADVSLAAAGPQRSAVSATSNGEEFLVAWSVSDGNDLDTEVVRVARNGAIIGAPRNLGESSQPLLASDGTDYLSAVRRFHLGQWTWSVRRIAADLSDVSPLLAVPDAGEMEHPSLLWNGSEYLFVASRFPLTEGVPFRLSAVRIGSHGRPLEAPVNVEDIEVGAGIDPGASAATNGNTILAAWIESTRNEADRETRVTVRRYSATTFDWMGNEVLLSVSANRQIGPSVAFEPAGTALAVWRETRGVYASRVAADGRSLDGRGIQLTASAVHGAPEVVFDGIQFVAAWIEGGKLEVRFITPFGDVHGDTVTIPNAQTFSIKNGFRGPMLAWSDDEHRIWATRLDRETRKADPAPVAVSPAGTLGADPALSWNGRETLVVWTEQSALWFHGFYTYTPVRIRGARLSSAFTVIDTAPLTVGDVPQVEDATPSVSSNGDDWLVTWSVGMAELRANRVLRNGNIAGAPEGTLLSAAAPTSAGAEVVFDRSSYAVVFKRGQALFTGFVPSNGPVAFNALVSLGNTRSNDDHLSITRTGTTVVVAYARVSDAPEHAGVERAFFRPVEPVRKMRSVR